MEKLFERALTAWCGDRTLRRPRLLTALDEDVASKYCLDEATRRPIKGRRCCAYIARRYRRTGLRWHHCKNPTKTKSRYCAAHPAAAFKRIDEEKEAMRIIQELAS